MKERLVWSVLLAFGALNVQAQVNGTLIVPSSHAARLQDRGVRVHGNTLGFRPEGRDGSTPVGETPASLACDYRLVTPINIGCAIETTTLNPSGGSRMIAVVEPYHSPNAASDLDVYSKQFGLPAANLQVMYQNGKVPEVDPTGGWEMEAAIAIEAAHAMAPHAQVVLVEAESNDYADVLATVKVAAEAVSDAGGGQVVVTWTGDEFESEADDDGSFVKAGVIFFAASGDSKFYLGYPSVSPNVVSAGGTSLNRDTDGKLFGERYWNNSAGAGGGGLSQYEPIPTFQDGIRIVGTQRGVPDMSFVADPMTGMAAYDSYPVNGVELDWFQGGGTALSAAALAGAVNAGGHFLTSSGAELSKIYDDYRNPVMYSKTFRDIKNGDKHCGKTWDICTGLGSVLTLKGK